MFKLPDNSYVWVAISITAFLTACTSQDLYTTGKEYQREQCRIGPLSEYEDCMKQINESYESYQRKREAVEDTK